MIGGGAATIISLLILGWTKEICAWVVPKGSDALPKVTIGLAVVMIYVLDFAINTGILPLGCLTVIIKTNRGGTLVV